MGLLTAHFVAGDVEGGMALLARLHRGEVSQWMRMGRLRYFGCK
jgi:hypothetical protein